MSQKQGMKRRSSEILGWDMGGPVSSMRANAGTVRSRSDASARRFEMLADDREDETHLCPSCRCDGSTCGRCGYTSRRIAQTNVWVVSGDDPPHVEECDLGPRCPVCANLREGLK